MKRPSKKEVIEFLQESNAIEGVYDDDSLAQALVAWKFLMEWPKLTVGVMLRVHKMLMLNQTNLLPSDKGYFRNITVYIGGKAAINAIHVPEKIEQLVLNMNDAIENGKKETNIWKEYITKEHHIQYEHIHPFIDGNGRTGRMFYQWERIMLGIPMNIIHEGQEQMIYYKWFK